VVTLHHFTNPRWLSAAGGWELSDVVDRFGRYVAEAVAALGDLVRYWVTINEPVIYGTMGYLDGSWPPGKRDFAAFFAVERNLLRGHARAARIIHDQSPRADVQVGVAHHVRVFDPYRRRIPGDHFVARLGEVLFNRTILRSLLDGRFRFPVGWGEIPDGRQGLDFIGLNYYSREMATLDFRQYKRFCKSFFAHPKMPKTSAG